MTQPNNRSNSGGKDDGRAVDTRQWQNHHSSSSSSVVNKNHIFYRIIDSTNGERAKVQVVRMTNDNGHHQRRIFEGLNAGSNAVVCESSFPGDNLVTTSHRQVTGIGPAAAADNLIPTSHGARRRMSDDEKATLSSQQVGERSKAMLQALVTVARSEWKTMLPDNCVQDAMTTQGLLFPDNTGTKAIAVAVEALMDGFMKDCVDNQSSDGNGTEGPITAETVDHVAKVYLNNFQSFDTLISNRIPMLYSPPRDPS